MRRTSRSQLLSQTVVPDRPERGHHLDHFIGPYGIDANASLSDVGVSTDGVTYTSLIAAGEHQLPVPDRFCRIINGTPGT
jgi:hypothetical protein